jgi:hypothetical protein
MADAIDLNNPAAVQKRRRVIYRAIFELEKTGRESARRTRPTGRYGIDFTEMSSLDLSCHNMNRWARDSLQQRIAALRAERDALPKRERDVILADQETIKEELKPLEAWFDEFALAHPKNAGVTEKDIPEFEERAIKEEDLKFILWSLEDELQDLMTSSQS